MSEPTWIGKTIGGRYQVEELLGQGGMSAVYKASDPNLRRAVAVKIIHPHLSTDQGFVRRFEEEAAAVAQLRHPNIIQVFDFNHEGNTYFIVFEFIPGESLQEYLKRLDEVNRTMSVDEAVDTVAKVADALEFAHEQGLIHRDVKPANVMINVRQEPILMDFGIAKIVGGTQHTATGAVLGTARYMSPEQIKGQAIDRRTDIYSLGVMLYEMLSGRAPFEADSAMTLMMMHIQDPVPDLEQVRPDVPPALMAVILKALEKDRSNRYQTAAEFAQALRNVNSEAPIARAAAAAPIAALTEVLDTSANDVPEPIRAGVVEPLPPPQPIESEKKSLPKWLLIGGGLIAALLLIGFIAMQFLGGNDDNSAAATATQMAVAAIGTETAVAIQTEQAPTATNTVTPTQEAAPILEPTPLLPTETPTPTATPLPSVEINDITIEDGQYVADFETIGFEPDAESLHVHFFFDSTSTENAGRPGTGPYEMVAVPSPFTVYSVSDRPAGAEQLCALVANPNHTIQLESGNCVDLPEDTFAPPLVVQPVSTATTAAIVVTIAPRVQITGISEANGRYNINFQTFGYTPALPGMHVHFFFNTVAPENAGVPGSGPWKLYGGPSPFTEYTVNDRPNGATQMCSLVANPDHSIQLGTGNCVNLP
jgi:predicted Ser/Thr protein kinase